MDERRKGNPGALELTAQDKAAIDLALTNYRVPVSKTAVRHLYAIYKAQLAILGERRAQMGQMVGTVLEGQRTTIRVLEQEFKNSELDGLVHPEIEEK